MSNTKQKIYEQLKDMNDEKLKLVYNFCKDPINNSKILEEYKDFVELKNKKKYKIIIENDWASDINLGLTEDGVKYKLYTLALKYFGCDDVCETICWYGGEKFNELYSYNGDGFFDYNNYEDEDDYESEDFSPRCELPLNKFIEPFKNHCQPIITVEDDDIPGFVTISNSHY